MAGTEDTQLVVRDAAAVVGLGVLVGYDGPQSRVLEEKGARCVGAETDTSLREPSDAAIDVDVWQKVERSGASVRKEDTTDQTYAALGLVEQVHDARDLHDAEVLGVEREPGIIRDGDVDEERVEPRRPSSWRGRERVDDRARWDDRAVERAPFSD